MIRRTPKRFELTALQLVQSPSGLRVLRSLLLAALLAAVVALVVVPWQQNVPGVGRVVAFDPFDRLQVIAAPVSGRVERAWVAEGSRVKKGDRLLEIVDNDPSILERLEEQRSALLAQLGAAQQRIDLFTDQIEALTSARVLAVEAARKQIDMARAAVDSASFGLEAAVAAEQQARLNYQRHRELVQEGLASDLEFEITERVYREAAAQKQQKRQALEAARHDEEARVAEFGRVGTEARARIDAARGSRESAGVNLGALQERLAALEVRIARQSTQLITAPRDGTVLKLFASPGAELVRAGDRLLQLVPDTESRAVEIWVDGNDVPLIQPGRPVRITLDPSRTFQTITAWEATDFATHVESPAWPRYRDELLDRAVELGLTRVRLEVRAGAESDRDTWRDWQEGRATYQAWRRVRYATSNDNDTSVELDRQGFHFSELDHTVEEVVLPLRERLAAAGERLTVHVCYVAFTDQNATGAEYVHVDPEEYAEFVLATYLHLRDTWDLVPDAWEVVLEPDNVAEWNGRRMGKAMVAAAARLEAAGFAPRFVAPSTASMRAARIHFDAMAEVPGALDHLAELSYHRYHGVSRANLEALAERAERHGIATAHLEYIGADHEDLLDDLVVGRNSAWAQYTIASKNAADRGGSYFIVDDSDPEAPEIRMGRRTPYLRQYFRWVRPGAVRVGATSDHGGFVPVAFVRPDGAPTVVASCESRAELVVGELPAGTYAVTYATEDEPSGVLPDVTLAAPSELRATIPAPGVLTISAR